ncbi:MAG: PASTA domain-containing protein [bacterium]
MLKKIDPKFILLGLIPFIGFMFGYAGGFFFFQTQTQEVPNLIGKDLHSAIESASAKQLSLRLLQEKEDALLPEGTIVQQTPRAFQKTRLNQSIFVTISKRTAPNTAPNLLQETREIITQKLLKNGISQKIITFATNKTNNTCVAQSPQPGETIQNQKITCYISTEIPNMHIMPNFKGTNLQTVQTLLQQKNITLEIYDTAGSTINAETNIDDQSRIITDQKPIAGSIINLNKPLLAQVLVS